MVFGLRLLLLLPVFSGLKYLHSFGHCMARSGLGKKGVVVVREGEQGGKQERGRAARTIRCFFLGAGGEGGGHVGEG